MLSPCSFHSSWSCEAPRQGHPASRDQLTDQEQCEAAKRITTRAKILSIDGPKTKRQKCSGFQGRQSGPPQQLPSAKQRVIENRQIETREVKAIRCRVEETTHLPQVVSFCSNGSFLPPWCLAGCPMSPFLPSWCLSGCPTGPFLPFWCLPGAFQTVQFVLSCLSGAFLVWYFLCTRVKQVTR